MDIASLLTNKEVTFALLFVVLFVYILQDSKKRSEIEQAREEKFLCEASKREEEYQQIIKNLTNKIEIITKDFTEKLEMIANELKNIKEIVCNDKERI